jgi:SpoVK/Ycf46/Vps4 family AAA+-type ATPase
MSEFRKNLENLLKARFPLIYIETYEEHRAIAEITAVVTEKDRLRTPRKIMVWSSTEGLATPGAQGSANSKSAADALVIAQTTTEPTVFIFKDLHTSFGDNGKPADQLVIRRLRDIAYTFKNGSSLLTLIIIAPVLKLPTDLDKEITILDFTLPVEAEILSVLESMVETNKADGRIIFELTDSGKEKLAKAAMGLTLNEAENAFARAMVEDGKLSDSDVDTVLDEKRQTIKKSGILEFINADIALQDVGGLQNLKRWLLKRDESWLDEAKSYGLPAPKGILITGVPGCGKSLTAKAIGAAWQLPLLRLDIGKIFAGLVGSSEQNMRTAIRTAEAIAPCILWIDEIEKGFAGSSGSGDSGTSARVFGSFLTWMQEKTHAVFVVATANNIDKLPPEFLRKGRFDEIFFVDLPTLSERKLIWELHIKKRLKNADVLGKTKLTDKLVSQLAEITEGYSGAEIEQAVVVALFDAFSEKRAINIEDLIKAVKNMVPLSITQAEAVDTMRDWANVRAVAATAIEDMAEIAPSKKIDAGTTPPISSAPTRGGRAVDF